ncbi:DUF4956 domain-containing protein [Nocardioides marmoribigeumensis]|jgi:hypothetical protein|uniref:DUF4956 domain-containing protein n=1 Tax=Nocardioides marmoribigeumensis TaxID=433649 RepID=A0ABU2BYI1_9ACTN|nr:DUF4956 domain-containing protein [Nocardioides marmoribigeumensis]MDR7363456.1 hypothetical protein [Nocardioides marmoribigeumensis]
MSLIAAIPHGSSAEAVGRLGLDVLAMVALVQVLYRRRPSAPEMALVLAVLNVGLFAAVQAIASGDFSTGVGFGLFGLLSLVRLRSAAFSLREMAYTFAALVLGLVNGLAGVPPLVVLLLDLLLLGAILVTDAGTGARTSRTMRVTLDQVFPDLTAASAAVESRLGVRPIGIAVTDVDYVRETTRVWVRYEVDPSMGSVPELVGVEAGDE